MKDKEERCLELLRSLDRSEKFKEKKSVYQTLKETKTVAIAEKYREDIVVN